MADQLPKIQEQQPLDLRAQERARFIRQQRLRPTFWISTAGAYLRYVFVLMLFCLLVIPPAVFYWGSQLASQYDIGTLEQLLTHVGVEFTATVPEGAVTEQVVEEDGLPFNPVGIALWGLIGLAAAVLGWFVAPIQSPLQKVADRHMMAWSGGSIEIAQSPVATTPPSNQASTEPASTSPETLQQKVADTHA